MSKINRERNYWPHSIVGSLLLIVLASAWTIKIAVQNPVEMDTFYMEKYQNVDENINEILALQEKFNAKFELRYSTEKFSMGDNTLMITLLDKQTLQAVSNADFTLMLSRPDSNQDNLTLSASKIENGIYTFFPLPINKPGRWQILTKVSVDGFKGYSKYEVYAVK